jgi:hypothetical protein
MRIITKSIVSRNIGSALKQGVKEINKELEEVDGKITKAYAEVSLSPSGGYVTINVAVSGNAPHRKSIIGVNQGGKNFELSMKKATEKLNGIIADRKGELVDVFSRAITAPLSGRTYTTIVAAMNEEAFMPANNAKLRRQRLKNMLGLLNDDPKAINISEVARVFGVSRVIIYKDLEELGFKR